jgi:hypothetical protein
LLLKAAAMADFKSCIAKQDASPHAGMESSGALICLFEKKLVHSDRCF